jgi:hypothetical protein
MANYGLSMSYPVDTNNCGTNSANYPASNEATNCSDNEGYPCCDQIGMGQDGGGARQASDPYYFWDNTSEQGTQIQVNVTSGTPSLYIQQGREFINDGTRPPSYAPFVYPHPDRNIGATTTCLVGAQSMADTGIAFWDGDYAQTLLPPRGLRLIIP